MSENNVRKNAVKEGRQPRAKAAVKRSAASFRKAPDFEGMIKSKEILWGEVTECIMEDDRTETMIVELDQEKYPPALKVKIFRPEADLNWSRGSMAFLIGVRIPFIILEKQGNLLTASRKQAQEIIFEDLLPRLAAEEVFMATVQNFAPFGAYVSVGGVVGVLKNTDYSIDFSEVREYLSPGDKVEVVCKEVTADKKLYFKAVNKVHRAEPISLDFKVGSVLKGEVTNIADLPAGLSAFIRVRKGIDVLCSIPEYMDLAVGDRVKVKITKITMDDQPFAPPKAKGNILIGS